MQFVVTDVYGPCDHALKPGFLDSIADLRTSIFGPWPILDDFNLIIRTSEESNENFNTHEALLCLLP